MIAANELRIGNIIYKLDDIEDTLKEYVVSIEENSLYWINKFPEKFLAIQLTEEILLKCNGKFRLIDCGWKYYDIEDLVISINVKDGRIFFSAFDRDSQGYVNDFDIELTSLHQWQNLYFALKGKEFYK